MWITTVTIDLIALQELTLFNQEGTGISQQINQVKNNFRSPENGGELVGGPRPPEDFFTIPIEQEILVVERAWNTQEIAQQYADAISNITPHVTVTVEEQI
jgi:hypothetical protein